MADTYQRNSQQVIATQMDNSIESIKEILEWLLDIDVQSVHYYKIENSPQLADTTYIPLISFVYHGEIFTLSPSMYLVEYLDTGAVSVYTKDYFETEFSLIEDNYG